MARANQMTYDFLAADQEAPIRQPLRETMKQSTVSRADINNEDLRAQLRTVQYELDSIKQERELSELRQQQELREAQNRAETDFKRAQAAEAASNAALQKAQALTREHQEEQDRHANEKLQLEKKVRSLQDDNRNLREEVEEAKTDLEEHRREQHRAYSELEQKHATLQASTEDIQQDLSGKVTALQSAQQKLARKEAEVGELENEVLRLKAQTGDSDTLAAVKKALSEQVAHIKQLEALNREQSAELKQFRKATKSIEVVEEEKRALEAKVRMMENMRRELAETQLQKRILEDEKKSWTSYLEHETGDEDLRYDTPEQMAKAFLQERLERADLLMKLGELQPELSVLEENMRSLEEEKARLQAELETSRATASNAVPAAPATDNKAAARLQRQKNLLTKEVEYLRAQMKTFEAEEAEFTPEQVDEVRNKRIQELEGTIDQYRTEMQTLQSELAKLEAQPAIVTSPRKRAREEDELENERLGELQRKARSLQTDLDKAQKQNHILSAELKASNSQIASLKESSRTRILSLRDNPTSEFEAIKLSALTTLREENAALLSQLEGRPTTQTVPLASLSNLRHQLQTLETEKYKMLKKDLRLKQIYTAKALEFREAVASILGWKLDFMPNGRVKATSILYPAQIVDGEEVDNSIVFDGENGTMKVSGGAESVFAGEIRGSIEFWVEGRKEIPCFLAALTLEFYDRGTREGRG